jgi:Xaa-Pro aminopeptidase
MTERAIAAEALRIVKALGGTTGFLNMARSGGITPFHPPTEDVIESTDCVGFDLQYRGPHGYAAELTRYYSFVAPPSDLMSAFKAQQHCFDECVVAIRPGVESDVLLETMRRSYEDSGFELAGPVGWGPVHMQLHGIGLDFTEPPVVPGQNLEIEEGMVLTLHPRLGPENQRFPELTVQDNILVRDGKALSMCFPTPTWTVLS